MCTEHRDVNVTNVERSLMVKRSGGTLFIPRQRHARIVGNCCRAQFTHTRLELVGPVAHAATCDCVAAAVFPTHTAHTLARTQTLLTTHEHERDRALLCRMYDARSRRRRRRRRCPLGCRAGAYGIEGMVYRGYTCICTYNTMYIWVRALSRVRAIRLA